MSEQKNQKDLIMPLSKCVEALIANYFVKLEECKLSDLYQVVLREVEVPLFKAVIEHTNGNQSKAASILGISRGTLRKKIAEYNL
jgi:Fis family transcriptional regulator, factor for inversion stimulation protein